MQERLTLIISIPIQNFRINMLVPVKGNFFLRIMLYLSKFVTISNVTQGLIILNTRSYKGTGRQEVSNLLYTIYESCK